MISPLKHTCFLRKYLHGVQQSILNFKSRNVSYFTNCVEKTFPCSSCNDDVCVPFIKWTSQCHRPLIWHTATRPCRRPCTHLPYSPNCYFISTLPFHSPFRFPLFSYLSLKHYCFFFVVSLSPLNCLVLLWYISHPLPSTCIITHYISDPSLSSTRSTSYSHGSTYLSTSLY